MEYDFFSTYLVDRVIPTNLAKLIIWIIINRSELSENVTSRNERNHVRSVTSISNSTAPLLLPLYILSSRLLPHSLSDDEH